MASKNNILQSAILSGVDPTTGEYLSPAQRKAIFRKRNINSQKVFGKPGAIVKAAPSRLGPKVQQLAEPTGALVKRIAILENQVSFLTKSIQKEAEIEKQTQKEFERTVVREDEKKERRSKENLLEKGFGNLIKPLLSTVGAIGGKVRGVLDTILDFFGILLAGWLTDKGLNAIKAYIQGDESGLKSIGIEVGKVLGVVTATLGIINGSLFTIIGISAAITAAILSAPFKLLWKGLKGLRGLTSPNVPSPPSGGGDGPLPNKPRPSGGGGGGLSGSFRQFGRRSLGLGRNAYTSPIGPMPLDSGPRGVGNWAKAGAGETGDVFGNVPRLESQKTTGFLQNMSDWWKKTPISQFVGKTKDAIKTQIQKIVDPIIKPLTGFAKGVANKLFSAVKKLPIFPQIASFLKKQGINVASGFGKLGQSAAGKLGAKALPFIGGIANLLFAYDRLANGDSFGAGLEAVSGILDFAGLWPLSLGIDAFLFARDFIPAIKQQEASMLAGLGLGPAREFLDNLGGKLPDLGELYKIMTGKKAQQPTPTGDLQLKPPQRKDFGPGREGEAAFKRSQREYQSQIAATPAPSAPSAPTPPPASIPEITSPSSPSFLPGPAAAAQPQIIYKRVPSSAQGQGSPLKSGSATDVPNISSSNPDNFYTLYSQMNYNVVI